MSQSIFARLFDTKFGYPIKGYIFIEFIKRPLFFIIEIFFN